MSGAAPVAHPPRRRPGYRISPVGAIAFLVILFWAVVAVLAPLIALHPVGEIVDFDFFGPMSASFPLGTDYLGIARSHILVVSHAFIREG